MDRKTELIRSSFDRWARNWDNDCEFNPAILDYLLSQIPEKTYPKILDLACGTGVMSQRLHDRFQGEVLGLDLSGAMIEVAQNKYQGQEGISFQNGDFYDFEGTGFDLILLHNGYPHFLDVPALSKKAAATLNQGGIFAVMHSCSREDLNHHHSAKAMPISFLLGTPEEEASRFKNEFRIRSCGENQEVYYFILEKK